MMQESDKQNGRLERLLRQWGADEARHGAEPPAMRRANAPSTSAAGGASRLFRWLPLAAAAVVLAAAVAVWFASNHAPSRTGEPDGSLAVATQPAGAADAELVKSLREEVEALRGKLADANSQLTVADERIVALSAAAGEAAGLRDEIERVRLGSEKNVAELEASLADERKARQSQADALAATEAHIAELTKAADALKLRTSELAAVRKEVESLKARLGAAGQELQRRRKGEEQTQASLDEARRQMLELKVRHREIVRAFQRTYLASVAPGLSGVEARKTAARARHMIERLADLSAAIRDGQTRLLLDRIDAVLTRLDLMNANRPGSGQELERLIRAGDLEAQIEEALASPGLREDVKNLLFEAKLILTGGADAG